MSRGGFDQPTGDVRGAVVVMAKAPREGFVKTRLTGAYPARDVVQLAECMLRDTLTLVQKLSRVHVAVMCPSEDVAQIRACVPAGVHVVGQRGHGLAAALVSAFEHFVPDFHRVVAIDSDSPHLPLASLHSAFELLETNELVVGPTEDGGYYLVGASAMHPRLFELAPLGRGNARDALLGRARALGLSVAFTEAFVRRRRAGGPAPARRRAAHRTRASALHRRAARVVATGLGVPTTTSAPDDATKPMRASHRMWASGAIIGLALLTFGLVRPDDGSVPFFVLLALAAVGYLATLHQVSKGLWPSGRTLDRLRHAGSGLARPDAARASRTGGRPSPLRLGRPPRSRRRSAPMRWFRPTPRSRI